MKRIVLMILCATAVSSTVSGQEPAPMQGSVAIRAYSMLRTGQRVGGGSVGDDMLPGEHSSPIYVAAGRDTFLCTVGTGAGPRGGSADGAFWMNPRVNETLRAAQFVWHFDVKMVEVSTDRIVFDLDWSRTSRVTPGPVLHHSSRFIMREGEIRPLDVVYGDAEGECASVSLEIAAGIKEDESLAGKVIDWDLWLVTEIQSEPIRAHVSSVQGIEVPFQFDPARIRLPGYQSESLLQVFGKIKGRLRRDGNIEVELLAQRSVNSSGNIRANSLPRTLLASSESGQKFFTINQGEAVKIVLPPFSSIDPVTGERITTAVARPGNTTTPQPSGAEMSVTVQASAAAAMAQQTQRQPTFFVTGNVRMPGAYNYEDGMLVRRAIEIAGGITTKGDPSRVSIRRLVGGRVETIAVTLDSPLLVGDQVEVGAKRN